MAKKVTRLFSQFNPRDYTLSLDIDKDNMTFSGQVRILGKKTGRPSKRLTFHQKDLVVESAKIVSKKTGKELEIERINLHNAYDEVRLHTKEMVYPGEYEVEINFSGDITNPMHGIYPCFYKNGKKAKTLIATQFESHSAREAFPCIDEPEAKAIFNLEIVSPKGETVIANTLVKSSRTKGNRIVTVFEPTPIMSSYLLAFAIGELHCIKGKTKDGVEVRSWAHTAQPIDHLTYANSEAIKVLEFFTDYFGTKFPLKKLDQIALPDFDSLAMENWGLITFREVGLLADPVNRSLSAEQLITLVIAHEISHQWFGNLVTMEWWDDLWLNESFASIMENIAPDRLHPDWNQWEDFATSRVLSCSHRDIYKDVQAVGVRVKHPDEILTLFDPAIVYAKGARILSMLYEYIGEDNFRKGLQLYFKENAYKNTTRDDLWKALSKVCGQDIGKIMTPWIEQSGQPLLSVKRKDQTLKLSQQRFLMDGVDKTSLWPIPLLADIELKPNILKKREGVSSFNGNEVPIINLNGSGHYIVKYEDSEMFDVLSKQIVERSSTSISRISLLNDMLLLARAGDYSLSSLLNIIEYCDTEPRDAVWSMMARIIGQAQSLTDGDIKTEADVKDFKEKLSVYWYDKLGWEESEDDEPNTKHLRSTALALAISGDNKEAIKYALGLFNKAGSVEKLPAEQRALVAGTAVRHGSPSVITKLMEEYQSSQTPDVKSSITAALCSTHDPKVAKRLISWGLKRGGVIKQQDIDHWFAYMMRNHYIRDEIWNWFTTSWDYILELFSGSKHTDYFVWYSAGPISTPEWQKKFVKFFSPMQDEPAMKRNISISLSEIEARVKWRKREEKDLIKFFSNQNSR